MLPGDVGLKVLSHSGKLLAPLEAPLGSSWPYFCLWSVLHCMCGSSDFCWQPTSGRLWPDFSSTYSKTGADREWQAKREVERQQTDAQTYRQAAPVMFAFWIITSACRTPVRLAADCSRHPCSVQLSGHGIAGQLALGVYLEWVLQGS